MPNKKPTNTEIINYIRNEYFSSYEGEWEELLAEIKINLPSAIADYNKYMRRGNK
jgi:hypothetical protein